MPSVPAGSVYFEQGWFGLGSRMVGESGRQVASIDGSYLPFLIEELLALSARKVLAPQGSHASLFAGSLTGPHAQYLEVVDGRPALERTGRTFQPVWDEFNVRPSPEAILLPPEAQGDDLDALMTLFDGIRNYLTGVEHRSAIGMDLVRLRAAIVHLRTRAHSGDARILLARFEGLLASYEETKTPTLAWISQAPREHVRAFHELMEDRDYVELSAEANSLGIPAKAARAVQVMSRLTRRLLEKSRFAELFTFGTRVFQTFTAAPIPGASSLLGLFATDYAPPIVDLNETMNRAVLCWLESDAPFVPPPLHF
jgi:hypothetical protein